MQLQPCHQLLSNQHLVGLCTAASAPLLLGVWNRKARVTGAGKVQLGTQRGDDLNNQGEEARGQTVSVAGINEGFTYQGDLRLLN